MMKSFIMALTVVALMAPVSAQAASVQEQRAKIQELRSDVLTRLYKEQPGAEAEIRNAAGYAVFSNANLTAFFLTAGYGYGLAHDNSAQTDTYMQMASGGIGLGLGVKDFRAVFIFDNPKVFSDFVNVGLDLSGHADAAVKAGTKGGAVSGAIDVLPGVHVYQLTETGLALTATLQGTKYWKDDRLNGADTHTELKNQPGGYNND